MKPEQRFDLDEISRREKMLQEAKESKPVSDDGFSRLGRVLVNLPWVVLTIALLLWWWKK